MMESQGAQACTGVSSYCVFQMAKNKVQSGWWSTPPNCSPHILSAVSLSLVPAPWREGLPSLSAKKSFYILSQKPQEPVSRKKNLRHFESMSIQRNNSSVVSLRPMPSPAVGL